MLSDGKHVAPVAVIYHAEAEWSGSYQPFEEVVKALALHQIDCDVIPIDTIVNKEAMRIGHKYLDINGESYKAIVIPYAERIPEAFIESLGELKNHGIPILFMKDYPLSSSNQPEKFDTLLAELKHGDSVEACSLEQLAPRLQEMELYEVKVQSFEESLRYYQYTHDDGSVYFFTNESKYRTVQTWVKVKAKGVPIAYDAMINQLYSLTYRDEGEFTSISLCLEPYSSLFIIFSEQMTEVESTVRLALAFDDNSRAVRHEIKGDWKVSKADALQYPDFELEENIEGLGNVSVPGILPKFSGTLKYETVYEAAYEASSIPAFEQSGFWLMEKVFLSLGEVYETAEVWINGIHAGTRICPPYSVEATGLLRKGSNSIEIQVTNTLAKQFGGNLFDRAMAQEPSGLVGPVEFISFKN